MAVDHFGRIHEPKRTGCDSAWYKDYTYGYPNNTNHWQKNIYHYYPLANL